MNIEEVVQEIKELFAQRKDFINRMNRSHPDHRAFLEQLDCYIRDKHHLLLLLLPETPPEPKSDYCGEGWT